MSVRVTIETASKAEAELIAQRLPVKATAQSWRGFGVIRVGAKSNEETKELIEAVSRSFTDHGLRWARVRYDDEEYVLRANGHPAG
jgi:O-glycosyl hydrolase